MSILGRIMNAAIRHHAMIAAAAAGVSMAGMLYLLTGSVLLSCLLPAPYVLGMAVVGDAGDDEIADEADEA